MESIKINKHLHSTMLLLYLGTGGDLMTLRQIYIPLCFYFIKERKRQEDHLIKFTFHYASTLSLLFDR